MRLLEVAAEYARSIGCEVDGDTIHCTEEQGEKLRANWVRITGAKAK